MEKKLRKSFGLDFETGSIVQAFLLAHEQISQIGESTVEYKIFPLYITDFERQRNGEVFANLLRSLNRIITL